MSAISLFEEKQVRRAEPGADLFAIVDVIAILTESTDSGAYWRKLKERLRKEGNETVTDCHGLKMTAADGKQRMTDVADTEQLLRLIQSVPSLKFSTALPHAVTEHGALMAANVLNSPEPKRIIGFKAIQDSTE